MQTIQLNINALKAFSKLLKQKPTTPKPEYSVINIKAGSDWVIMEATNGAFALKHKYKTANAGIEEGAVVNCIIPRAIIDLIDYDEQAEMGALTLGHENPCIEYNGISISFALANFVYPDLSNAFAMFDGEPSSPNQVFNYQYVGAMHKAVRRIYGKVGAIVNTSGDKDNPAMVCFTRPYSGEILEDVFGVVMPMTTKAEGFSKFPDWMIGL